ncbi:pyrroline-5-carboxylate reductase family protein [Arthrobacter sp. NPDC056691]|uniref:pyrroline-5-carboxylate reductase family protein n=1 Tax=unclassified Arthrobacter TaxID=235627 RepID=UPI003671C4A8
MELAVERIVTVFRETGTAYTFQLAEAMAAAGVGLGLEPETAVLVARETVAGAGFLLAEDGANPAALRSEMASRGTMTERAIAVFDELGLLSLVAAGLRSAVEQEATQRG